MPLIIDSHDSLPYIDRTSTGEELDAARALLQSSVDPSASTVLHSSVSASYEPHFSELVTNAHEIIASTGKARPRKTGIDLTRYEEPTAPSGSPDISATERRSQWSHALSQAYTSHAYLSGRQLNLSLLERYGKNAWLIGNSQLEEELRTLEKELGGTKRQIEELDEERRRTQETVRGEIEGLEEAWRSGVGRSIEAEVAGEGLRRQILDFSRRHG